MQKMPDMSQIPLVLIEKLECFISDQVEACKQLKPPYNPTIWLKMQKEYGTLTAIWKLLGPESEGLHSGFKRLAPNHLNLTLEYAISKHPEIFDNTGWALIWANARLNIHQFSKEMI